MQCSTLLPLLLLIFSNWKGEASSSPRTLKLCLYLKAIRRSTAECDQVTLDNLTSVEGKSFDFSLLFQEMLMARNKTFMN